MSDISKINIDKKEYFFKDAEGRARAEEAATEAENAAKEYTDAQVKALKGEVSEDFNTLEKTENMIMSLGNYTNGFIHAMVPKVNEIDETAKTALDIAQGNTRSEVFETTSAMYTWLADAANKGVLKTGDSLYVKELDVPDWWITEALDAPNADGRYYNIAPLEAEGAGGAAGPIEEFEGELIVDGWIGNLAPYTQTVVIDELSDYNNCAITLSSSATEEQMYAAALAEINDISYDENNNTITFVANGEKPTVVIPFTVCAGYSMNVVEMPNYLGQEIPTNHASSTTNYGAGSVANYGHVKVSDSYKTSDGVASAGVAASSKAVSDAYFEMNSGLNEISGKVDQIANNQIPEEYLKAAVDEYVNENNGGFVTKDEGILGCVIENKSKQLYNKNTVNNNTLVSVSGGLIDRDGWATTDYIKVEKGHRVYFYQSNNHSAYVVYGLQGFDKDKNLIELITTGDTNYIDNTDYDYIRLSFSSDIISIFAVEMDGQTITESTPYVETTYTFNDNVTFKNIYNPLYKKTLGVLGDSITYGAGVTDRTKVWGSLIAERNSMTFTNLGVSGSTMGEAVDGSNTNASYKNNRHLALKDNDYALVWFGWNDHNFCSLGTADGTDTTQTLPALRKTLEYIITNSVSTKVGVIIPYLWDYNTEPQDHTIMEMINGIKSVCELCGVPYLDLPQYNFLPCWGSDVVNNDQYYIKWNARQEVFTTDSLHPNEKGNEYLATIIENFLRSL